MIRNDDRTNVTERFEIITGIVGAKVLPLLRLRKPT